MNRIERLNKIKNLHKIACGYDEDHIHKEAFFGSLRKFFLGEEDDPSEQTATPAREYKPSKSLSERAGAAPRRMSAEEIARLAIEKEKSEYGRCGNCKASLFSGEVRPHRVLGKITECSSCESLNINKGATTLDCGNCGAPLTMSGISNAYIPGKGLPCSCISCQKMTWLDESGKEIIARRTPTGGRHRPIALPQSDPDWMNAPELSPRLMGKSKSSSAKDNRRKKIASKDIYRSYLRR